MYKKEIIKKYIYIYNFDAKYFYSWAMAYRTLLKLGPLQK